MPMWQSKTKKEWRIILERLKIQTKDRFIKPLGITLLSVLFLGTVTCIKYKPAYKVTVSGTTLGYVDQKNELDYELNEFINNKKGTIALIDIANMPEYSFELISRRTESKTEDIYNEIKDSAIITYKTYAITVNGEIINEVATRIEAEDIVSKLETGLIDDVDFNLGIAEIYKTEDTSEPETTALENLNSIKLAKIEEYEAEQARLEAERKAAEEAARLEAERLEAERKAQEEAERRLTLYAQASVASEMTTYGSGNISGINLSYPLRTDPLITSRFGESSSRRSSTHTGLDLATALGTGIYPIAEGTVVFAGWQGSYGYLIQIDHGDGIQSWYGHCNELYVSAGEYVTTETCIGAVGSTGNSTGPHLHLEIRINGEPVNPQYYLY